MQPLNGNRNTNGATLVEASRNEVNLHHHLTDVVAIKSEERQKTMPEGAVTVQIAVGETVSDCEENAVSRGGEHDMCALTLQGRREDVVSSAKVIPEF